MTYAVFMDYELDGVPNTVVLGGSIGNHRKTGQFLHAMARTMPGYSPLKGIWIVDEDDLPWGYKFQTYYMAAYDATQQMIGVH